VSGNPVRECQKARDKVAHEPHTYLAGRYLPVGDLGFDADCPGWSDPYPQHTALLAVANLSQAQGEFVGWLVQHGYADLFGNVTDLLAEFHGIDMAALEAEKRAMLAAIRDQPE
jgi:hypothetical protein